MLKRNFLILAFFVLSLPSPQASAFDYAAYKPASLSEVVVEWDRITREYEPGYSIKTPPERIAIEVNSTSNPFKCKTEPLQFILTTLDMKGALEKVPVSHCIKVRGDNQSSDIILYMQDALVSAYRKEVAVGATAKLYVLFIAYAVSTSAELNFPVFLVNGFTAP